MYNCLQKIKAHFSQKLLVVLTIFMMICVGVSAQAVEYTWTGSSGTDYNWTTPGNWSPDTAYPQAADKAIISSDAAITIDDDITVADIEITGATVSFSTTDTPKSLTITNSLSNDTNSKTYFLCSVDLSSVASADFTNSGTVYFYNNSDNLYTFKTPENCNLGNFYFLGKLEIIIDGNNCRATNFNMEIDSDTSSYFATDDFKVILSGTGTLKATNVNLTRASKTAGKTGTFEIGKDSSNTKFEISDSIETHSGVILQINEGATLETEKYAHNAGNADVIAKTIINGTFIANTSFDTAISISANAGSTEVTIGTDGVLTSPNIQPTTTTYRNTTASTIPFTNNGTINTKTFNIPYNVVNNGIINTNATPATITALSFSGTDGTINLKSAETTLTATSTTVISSQKEIKLTNTEATIKGNYFLTNFTATTATNMSGKSITLENAAITANSISLSGSAGSLLTLDGSGSAHSFTTSSLTAEYLSIDENIILLNYSTAIAHCEPSAGDTTTNWLKVIQNGWAIKALKTFTFTWTGDTDSIWNKDSNWDTGLIPEEDCKIIIPAGCDNYPVLGSDTYSGGTLTLSDTTSKITLGTADLSLSGKENEATASTTLSNAGTIVFTGNGRITDGTDAINDVSHGTVEYAGTGGSVNDFGTTDYNNLIISRTNWQIDGDCTVQNSFSIADGGTCKISTATSITAESITIADGGSCSVSAETNLKAKTFAFYGSGTNKNLTSSANINMIFIPATANADVNIPSGIDSSFSFESTGTLHLENESTGKLVFSDSDTFNVFEYKLNFHSPVILKQDIKVQNSVTAAESITAGDTSGTSALIFQGSSEIEFNPTTDKTYQNITINDTGCSLTVNNNGYTITNCTITKATSTTFDGTPAITYLSDDTTAGNITFNNGANITNAVSLETTGKTTVKRNISAASFSAKNLVAGADAAINTTGAQTYGTINGTTAEAQDLTLTASAVTINDNVGTTRRLDILTINAPLTIGTTGKQISAKEIDFAGDISGSDKNLTITTAKLKSTIAADGTSAITLNQLTLSQATTIGTENASTLSLNISKISGTSTLTFDENATQINLKDGIEINPNIINKRNVICNGAATFNGTFTNTSGSLTGDQTTGKTLTFKKKYSGTGATLIAAKATNTTNGITIFQADVDLSDTTFNASGGTVILSGATAPASQLLTTKNDGTTAFNKLTINGNVTFATSNTIDTLTANNLGDKTLSFYDNTTQTITTLSLTGTNKDHKLTLTSTGHWNISCTNEPELKFLIVDNSTNSTPGTPAPGTKFVAFDSIDGGSNVYWNFPDMEYKWTGTTSSDWRTASNWYPASIPGIGSKIIIQPADNYPILDFELILAGNNSTAVITVEENAIFDIADNTLTLGLSDGVTITPGTITNKGTVIITGVNSQSINYTTMENSGDDSTVIYSGTSPTVNFIWDGDNSTSKKDYKNLQISNIVNATADLNISRNLTINKNISLLTGSISVSGETTIQTDCTTVNTSGNQTYNDSVTISTAGSGVSINSTTGNLLFSDTVTGTKLTVSGNTIKFSGVVGTTTTPLGQLSIGTATTTTFDEPVYISTFTDSDTGNSGAITFSKGGIISNDVSLNTTGNVYIDGSTTEMSFNGDFSHTTGTTSITGTITSAGTVSLGAADKLTTISSAEINAASLNCNILKISGDVTIKTSGTQTYNGTINASTADSDTLTLKSTGLITFNGNIGSVTPLLKSLTTTTGSAVQIDCESIKTAGNQTYNDSVTISTAGSGVSINSTTGNLLFANTVTGTKLTVSGNTIQFSGVVGTTTTSLDQLSIGAATTTTFDEPVYISTFTDSDTGNSGAITFSKGGIISNDVSLNTTGNVSIDGSTTEMNFNGDFSHTTGTTSITGTITSAGTVSLGAADKLTTISSAEINAASLNCNILKISGDVTIETSGTQTYNGTINASTADSDTLTLKSTGLITFNGNIGSVTPLLKALTTTPNTPVLINCASIKSSISQEYNGAVTLGTTLSSHAITSSTITFGTGATINGNASLVLEGTTSSTFNASIGNTTPLTSIEIKGPAIINCSDITTSDTQVFNDIVTLKHSVILSSGSTVIFKDNVSNSDEASTVTLTVNANTKIDASSVTIKTSEFDFSGNITGSETDTVLTLLTPTLISTAISSSDIKLAKLIINQDTILKTSNTSVLYVYVSEINNSGKILIIDTSVSNFEFKQACIINTDIQTYDGSKLTAWTGITTFAGNLTISGDFAHNNGTIKFAGTTQTLTTKDDGSTNFYNILISSPAKVTTASSFIVSGTSWDNTSEENGFTATAGTITFDNATVPASAPLTTVSGKNIFYDVACKTTDQNITFEEENIFSHEVTIGESANIPNNVIISSASAITFAPELYCQNITINAGENAVTFTDDSYFNTSFTNNGTGLVTFDGSATYGTSFINESPVLTTFKSSFTGTGNAEFAGDINLTDDADRFFSAGAGHSITTANNLIVNTNTVNTIQMNSTPTSKVIAKNFVLYSGKLKLNGTLESTGDIILLGPDYTTLDPQTGIDGIYLYNQTRPSPVNYTTAFIAAPYNGDVTALENAVIKAGKNFYSNGIILTGPVSGYFEIQLPKISDSHKGFAEAVKAAVNNCNVRCWELPSNTATDDIAPAKIAAYECTDNSNNTNWNFEDFEILNAWTERDDAIFVEFNSPVRNLYNEITNSLPYLTYQGTTNTRTAFAGIYTKPDCQNADLIENIDIELTNGRYSFFLKAPDSWNTDATGTSAGSSALSSDRNGNYKTSVPYLDIPRSLTGVNYIITNKWGKRLNNYSTRTPTPGKSYGTNETAGSETYVLDKTGPVLWSVRTGQELHTAYNSAIGESCQHSYDSHNFLEFRYSEPVEFNSNSIPTDSENNQVTDTFGAISGNAGFTTATNTLTFAGIARLTAPSTNQLLLNTGSQGSANKYINALYRTDEYSLRLSIAGWTDGTVSDYSGNEYKNWKGYIDEAKPFTGAQVFPIDTTNNLVTDLQGNLQIEYEANKVEPLIISNSIDENPSHLLPVSPDVYSAWDISEPVFAPLRLNSETTWTETKNADTSEAIGNTNGSGSTLDRIDFHFFDNTPAYSSSDTAEWFTESGWCTPSTAGGKENLYDNTYTYAADIIGGARQFDPVQARRTSGGIRLSTKLNAAAGFKYSTDIDEINPSTAFATGLSNIHTTVISQLFTGASEPQHSANDPDGLYLGIGITDTDLPVETSFAFSYNYSNAFLTDLAGNRLRNKTISKTIDRTPPSFDIILSPVNQKQIYIVFVKKILTDSSKISFRYPDGSNYDITGNFMNILPSCFQIITINSDGSYSPSTDIEIDTSIPAKIVEQYSDSHFTCISMTLTKEICFEDIKNLHIQLKNHPDFPETSPDIYTNNNNAKVTFIQDELGNYMQMYSAHALSDFAIGLVNPLYAYSSDINENDEPVMNGLYEQGSWAVHDWDADQKNYGTLPTTHAVTIIASEEDGTEDNSQIPENVRLYLSDSPDSGSVSTQFNKDFKTSLRVWLPDLTDGIFRALSAKNNSNFTYVDSSLLNEEEPAEGLIFDIPVEMINRWKNGDQISFIFGITESDGSPVSIFNSPYYDNEQRRYNYALSSKVPLYSLRMHDITDIGTLDLWSFRLKSETAQRGGVTILNNVIDAGKGEKTVVKISLPDEGRLNVIVMTLDGNIITYLNRGNTKAGEHYFTWDGKNRNGKPVARGMYFVRVIGSGIDETRKVMVVK
ncbi:FlgD immunoglobulin-like domain containing protein [Treponema bryantii]|uniref:FlgD immunoglobulin-like domain containing protein n=1 Tax=Treponema bryantii TaxID=163 RepID=UPI002B29FEC5|nr:hypothetical protein TRBR_07390 [Treponema bryantii]